MPKTALALIQRAYGTSRLNDANSIDDEADALLALLSELLRGYYAEGARANRKLFAQRVAVPFDNGAWKRPPNAELVMRLEAGADTKKADDSAIAAGTEVIELPFDQRQIEQGRPAVYELGQRYYTAGRAAVDPAKGGLVFMAAVSPDDLEDLEDELPEEWPESAGNPLLKWDLAIYLAQKDGERDNEVTAFTGQRERAHARFLAFCETASTTEVRNYGHTNRANSPAVST